MFLIHAHSIGGKWCVENTTGANRNSSIELVSLEWKTFENRKHLRFIRGEFNWKSQNRINLDLLAFAYQISTISVCEDPGHSNLFHDHFAFCFVDQNCSDSIYNLHSSFLKPKYKTNDVYKPFLLFSYRFFSSSSSSCLTQCVYLLWCRRNHRPSEPNKQKKRFGMFLCVVLLAILLIAQIDRHNTEHWQKRMSPSSRRMHCCLCRAQHFIRIQNNVAGKALI